VALVVARMVARMAVRMVVRPVVRLAVRLAVVMVAAVGRLLLLQLMAAMPAVQLWAAVAIAPLFSRWLPTHHRLPIRCCCCWCCCCRGQVP
jgi:hypothetical protein